MVAWFMFLIPAMFGCFALFTVYMVTDWGFRTDVAFYKWATTGIIFALLMWYSYNMAKYLDTLPAKSLALEVSTD